MAHPVPPMWLEARPELGATDSAHLEHARSLVRAMTLEEKLPFLHQHSPGLERLGIGPFSTGTEALHGVAWRGPAVTYPQPVGLAATWDEGLLAAVGDQIAREVREHHAQEDPASLNVWSPVVNPLRHPLWGRTEEGLSEDPLLNARLGTAIARGLRGEGPCWTTVPTLKHFLGYSHEVDRAATSSSLPPRVLHEYELPGYEEALASGAAGAVMLSYNLVDGVPAHLSPLVNDHLRRVVADPDLLFVVSDAGAPTNLVQIQDAAADLTEAVAAMLRAGVDSFTDHGRDSGPTLRAAREALARGLVQEQHIDHAVVRQLVARARTGEFGAAADASGHTATGTSNSPTGAGFDRARAVELSQEVAARAAVLLRHQDEALPARPGSTLAVIGHLGGTVLQDWYSGELMDPVSLREALEDSHDGPVRFAAGLDIVQLSADGVPVLCGAQERLELAAASFKDDVGAVDDEHPGLGEPSHAAEGSDAGGARFEVRDHGHGVLSLRETSTGLWLAPDAHGHLRARAPRIGGWVVQETFRPLRSADGRVRLQHVGSGRWLRAERQTGRLVLGGTEAAQALELSWQVRVSGLQQAREAMDGADLAILVAGNEPHVHGRETEDRPSLSLAGPDQSLVDLLGEAAPTTKTALVLFSSYPCDLGRHEEAAQAVVWSSHAGARQGPALASLLRGEREFSGRLAQAWIRERALTDILDYDVISSAATYLYGQEALYPFGHGLALEPTRWSDVALEASGQSVSVAVTLERDGARSAHEVVQVYATVDAAAYPHDLGPLPALRLIGSRVVEVPASGGVRARLEIPWTRLRVWSEEAADFVAPTGTVTLHVARSSADVERSAEVSVPVL